MLIILMGFEHYYATMLIILMDHDFYYANPISTITVRVSFWVVGGSLSLSFNDTSPLGECVLLKRTLHLSLKVISDSRISSNTRGTTSPRTAEEDRQLI